MDILNNGLGNADALTFPSSLLSTINSNAVAQLIANRTFLGAEVTAWVAQNLMAELHGQQNIANEISYAIDALCYDIHVRWNKCKCCTSKKLCYKRNS